MDKPDLNPRLKDYIRSLETEFQDIVPERINILKELGDHILEQIKKETTVRLIFICTHNARRSQIGQAWAATAVHYHGLDNVLVFSGGTESTAFDYRAVEALRRAGFEISIPDRNDRNPEYALKGGEDLVIKPMLSKKYDDPLNPSVDFTAIMVCSHADEACPFIPGASARFAITYDDPNAFDGSSQETEKYDERCRQIAREIFFAVYYVISSL